MAAPPGPEVQAMFAEIAPRYDFLNRLLSFGIDRRWRRRTIRALDLAPGQMVLDLCCGTGDLALAFSAAGQQVCAADFTLPMLLAGRHKAGAEAFPWIQADAQALPFADAHFDAITIAFGIRNVAQPQRALAECHRVLKPGGQLAILEFFRIPNPLWRALFRAYFGHVLPVLAGVVRAGRSGAYRYLPASVEDFASPSEFHRWLLATPFATVREQALTGGVARLFLARKEA